MPIRWVMSRSSIPRSSGYVCPFSSTFNDYVRSNLKFESDLMYEFLSPNVGPWDFSRDGGYLNVATTLQSAIDKVPSMKVLICSGYFDLATPFTAADYTVNQMPLGELRKNIVQKYYEGGHMLYLNHPALVKLHSDLQDFSPAPCRQPKNDPEPAKPGPPGRDHLQAPHCGTCLPGLIN